MRVAIHTLGCKANQYETQAMEAILRERGHTLVPFDGEADAYVVNSCTVTAVSDRKSRQAVRQAILGCSTVLLESNHDRNMLFNGPYPYPLKRRIDSAEGHLNNEAAAETSAELLESGTTQIILGHLSSQNNLPELAFETASQSLRQDGAKIGLDIRLAVAPRQNVLRTEVSE